MILKKVVDTKFGIIYRELASTYPEILPEVIDSAVQFKTIADLLNSKKEEIFNQFGLTSGRFHLMMILKVEPGNILSPSELARRIGVTRATMTQFIDALEKNGLVERTSDPKDRRGMLVQLSASGTNKLNQIMPNYLDRLSSFCSPLTIAEREQFHYLMGKIQSSL